MPPNSRFDSGGEGGTRIPSDPTAQLGFEIGPTTPSWSFTPTYYPDRFVQVKDRKTDREGRQCSGENVSLKTLKNREFHVKGIILASEVAGFQKLMDYEKHVDIISPLTKRGGVECVIDHVELGEKSGFDPIEREWQFEYTIDLISTGADEYDRSGNSIVTAITGVSSTTGGSTDAQVSR